MVWILLLQRNFLKNTYIQYLKLGTVSVKIGKTVRIGIIESVEPILKEYTVNFTDIGTRPHIRESTMSRPLTIPRETIIDKYRSIQKENPKDRCLSLLWSLFGVKCFPEYKCGSKFQVDNDCAPTISGKIVTFNRCKHNGIAIVTDSDNIKYTVHITHLIPYEENISETKGKTNSNNSEE